MVTRGSDHKGEKRKKEAEKAKKVLRSSPALTVSLPPWPPTPPPPLLSPRRSSFPLLLVAVEDAPLPPIQKWITKKQTGGKSMRACR